MSGSIHVLYADTVWLDRLKVTAISDNDLTIEPRTDTTAKSSIQIDDNCIRYWNTFEHEYSTTTQEIQAAQTNQTVITNGRATYHPIPPHHLATVLDRLRSTFSQSNAQNEAAAHLRLGMLTNNVLRLFSGQYEYDDRNTALLRYDQMTTARSATVTSYPDTAATADHAFAEVKTHDSLYTIECKKFLALYFWNHQHRPQCRRLHLLQHLRLQ